MLGPHLRQFLSETLVFNILTPFTHYKWLSKVTTITFFLFTKTSLGQLQVYPNAMRKH